MIEVQVESVRVSVLAEQHAVFLKEHDGGRRLLIWIGAFEAHAIATGVQGLALPRPLPYDALGDVLDRLGARLTHVAITRLDDGVFYASLVVRHGAQLSSIDSRASDAIAVAVRRGVPILVDDDVMAEGSVLLDDDIAALLAADTEDDGEETAETAEAAETAESTTGGTGRSAVAPDSERLAVFRDFINGLDIDDLGTSKPR